MNTGEWGETVACRFLRSRGWKIVGRRVRIRRDELDIVAGDGKIIVFVEVKTRRTERFGLPATAVDAAKQRRISRAAVRYLKKLRNRSVFFRFDIVEVIGEQGKGSPEVRHIPNAFTLHRNYRYP